MTRFGDFTLLEDLGRSAVADRYKATHATQGGPFFLKVYTRLEPSLHDELLHRCEALIGKQHPNLSRHLGHGVVEGLPFVVAPYLDGIDLGVFSSSLLDRRVTIGLESVLLVLGDLTTGVGALHSFAPANNGVPFMGHGDVSLGHVRVGPEGQVWLTGLTTPRGDAPGRPPEARWDLAGVGALVYDLVPLLLGGAARPPLPAPLDRVVRRALGIGLAGDRIGPAELVDRLGEVTRALKLRPDRAAFAELVKRTVRVVEKRLVEAGGRASPAPPNVRAPGAAGARRSPADAIPSLDPVDRLPTLEPIERTREARPVAPPVTASRPAPILDLEPLPIGVGTPIEGEAKTEMLEKARPPPPRPAPSADPLAQPDLTPWNLPADEPPILARPDLTRSSAAAGSTPGAAPRATPQQPFVPPAAPQAAPRTPPRAAPPPPAPARSATPPPARPTAAPPFSSLEDAASPHTDPRAIMLPRAYTPVETAFGSGPSPFTDLPPDVTPPPRDDAPTHAPPARPASTSPAPSPPAPPPAGKEPDSGRPPPLPRAKTGSSGPSSSSPASQKRPLLVDPPEPSRSNKASPALVEPTKDSTDPEQRLARAENARRDRGVKAVLARRLVSEKALQAAIDEHVARGGRVLEILVAHGEVTDASIAAALAAESGRPRLPDEALKARPPPAALTRRLPQTYLLARRVLPLSLENGVLAIAVADPFDRGTLEELAKMLGASSVEPFVAARAAITAATIDAYRAIGGVPGTGSNAARALLCTADDAKATRIGARLAQEGIRVEHVLDGTAAREILLNRPPDVVLCAHDLAGEDNVTALLLFVRSHPTADLPFFVFGPRGEEELAARMLDLGADDFFPEPLKLEVMLAKVRRAVGKGRNLSTEGWALNDPSAAARILTAPPPSVDERTHITAIPPMPPTTQSATRSDPGFLDSFSLPSLDDLPELPADFSGEAAPDTPPAMPTGVMGTLRQMALSEIVQSLEMGRKTARVDLVPAEGEKGMIAFETGQIRYAECGELRGDDAFYQLARHKEGFFRIHYGDKPPAVNIEAPTTFLLLEAMRRMDEEGVVPGTGG
jgi:DNA-binding response OmpR family regulator